ncbi:MAG: HNH endonuclease [Acidobacteria bacterium]|nr:HNH endonuclease [Acidobacteriota bacterium]
MKKYSFFFVYELAALVDGFAGDQSSYNYIDWSNPAITKRLRHFSKDTILHHFIYQIISTYQYERAKVDGDTIACYEKEKIEILETAFHEYSIAVEPYSLYLARATGDYRNHGYPVDCYLPWYENNKDSFNNLWMTLTPEVFHILFPNRSFLLKFNLGLAQYLTSGKVKLPSELLTSKGFIKRDKTFPAWLKKAVYFREHGRCIFCEVDLSGLLSTDRQIHYDHMVPLARFGVNDPANIQLLCQACNLKKLMGEGSTSTRYAAWWD